MPSRSGSSQVNSWIPGSGRHITRRVSIQLTPEVKVGDYVLLHTGYAINIIDPVEAEETLKLLRELNEVY
ncbi:HypC/HybG/HupF family hydrogenase formation chaperone [Thermodesulfovibrionales bacterium]|nr:HypC/HybG/HupF family hydrogenase formation chaperone [Thermodesulfovibrionales bacterium]